MRSILIFLLLFASLVCYAQIRQDKLVINTGETYELTGSDIIVLDTLIMQDSSKIILNRQKLENYIHAKVIRVGRGCQIIGHGMNGIDGEMGLGGYTAIGPCKNGIPGRKGTPGSSATPGVNLFIYFNSISITGKLFVELSGGNGGDGGKGGNGGGGSPGTRLCQGGNGGAGGDGSSGGDGGNGGDLTLSCKACPDLLMLMNEQFIVRSYGGNAGLGGDGGLGGLAGLVSAGRTQDGEQGPRGKQGKSGESGKDGAINIEQL